MASSFKPIRAAIYGACHADALHQVLRAVPGLGGRIQFVPLPSTMQITAEEMAAFVASLPDLDLVIYQPISADYRGPEFASARIVEAAETRTMLLSFAYYHFEIYTPFVANALPGLPEPPAEYMDYLLGALVARGFTDAQIVDKLLHLEGLDPYVYDMVAASFYEFDVREDRVLPGDRPLDIKISDKVRATYKTQRLGHTPNHPSAQVLRWIADDVLARIAPLLGRKFESRWSFQADPLKHTQFFAPPFVRQAFDLTFKDRERMVIHRKTLSTAAYVRDQRPFYESIPKQALLDAVETIAQPAVRPWYKPLLTTT